MILLFILNLVELHWHAAVINSDKELDFIQRNQKELKNTQDFFIGGSSNSTGAISNLSYYLPNQSGIRNITKKNRLFNPYRIVHNPKCVVVYFADVFR